MSEASNASSTQGSSFEAPVPVGMNRHTFQSVIFDLPFRYQPIKLIGKGTYGSVISATNT